MVYFGNISANKLTNLTLQSICNSFELHFAISNTLTKSNFQITDWSQLKEKIKKKKEKMVYIGLGKVQNMVLHKNQTLGQCFSIYRGRRIQA